MLISYGPIALVVAGLLARSERRSRITSRAYGAGTTEVPFMFAMGIALFLIAAPLPRRPLAPSRRPDGSDLLYPAKHPGVPAFLRLRPGAPARHLRAGQTWWVLGIYLGICAFLVAFSRLWLSRFSHGPIELVLAAALQRLSPDNAEATRQPVPAVAG